MSTNKRRQICKGAKQTQIQFTQIKGHNDQLTQKQEYLKKVEASGYNYDSQSGAKDSSTPYRSVNRINTLLKRSPFYASHENAKLMETPSQFAQQLNMFNEFSKPSSATTACTYAPNELTQDKNDLSSLMQRKREDKSERKNTGSKRLAGQKRKAQMKLDNMEYFMKLQSSSAKFVAKNLKLKDKKTGKVFEFSLLDENQISGFKNNSVITSFDMSKLEVEYDYDTEDEQLTHSKSMLLHELFQAIDFFIKEDPFKLVDNILL